MLKSSSKIINLIFIAAFIVSSLYIPQSQAGEMVTLFMPKPGIMLHLSPAYTPANLKGIIIHPENALKFDFLVEKGDGHLDENQKKEEYKKLIKYFLASLTVPDKDQWVNLSPYEKNRIISSDFGKTEMGRDLLDQDYLLKQITSSLMFPGSGLGQTFWNKVYESAYKKYGTTNIPVNTFNKVWIVPDQALIYESGNTAYVVKSHLKVMLEEDYLSLKKHSNPAVTHTVASKIIKEIILPEIEREVNEGKNFAMLRQIFSGMLLATWYKKALKESLLWKIYADKKKVAGVDFSATPQNNVDVIYKRYLLAFKEGVYSYIKEDLDKNTNQTVPRKYFSGGFDQDLARVMDQAQVSPEILNKAIDQNQMDAVTVVIDSLAASEAGTVKIDRRELLKLGGAAIAGAFVNPTKAQAQNGPVDLDSFVSSNYRHDFIGQTVNDQLRYVNEYKRDPSSNNFIQIKSKDGEERTIRVGDIVNYTFPGKYKGIALGRIQVIRVLKELDQIFIEPLDVEYIDSVGPTNTTIDDLIYYPLRDAAMRAGGRRFFGSVAVAASLASSAGHANIPPYFITPEELIVNRESIRPEPGYSHFLALAQRGLFDFRNERDILTKFQRLKRIDVKTITNDNIGFRALLENIQWPLSQGDIFNFMGDIILKFKDNFYYISERENIIRARRIRNFEEEMGLGNWDYVKGLKSLQAFAIDYPLISVYSTGSKTGGLLLPLNLKYIKEVRLENITDITVNRNTFTFTMLQKAENGGVAAFSRTFTFIPTGRAEGFFEEYEFDEAMAARTPSINAPGGIDFNAANMYFQIKRDGVGIPLPWPQQDMAQINRINGFEPRILSIKPVSRLPLFRDYLTFPSRSLK